MTTSAASWRSLLAAAGWCEAHQHLPPYLPNLEQQFERVIIFPSSFDVTVESVREALSSTRALVFAREFVSYEQIRHLCQADIAHDTAFFFDFEPYRRRGHGRLLAFRTDREAPADSVPVGNRDISLTCESLDEFLWAIAQYEVVETNRAHVMIAAALMGKEVRYHPSNYHKLPALAASSLQQYPVHAVSNGEIRQSEVTRDERIWNFGDRLVHPASTAVEREQLLHEILNSRSFRLISFYWRLRARVGI